MISPVELLQRLAEPQGLKPVDHIDQITRELRGPLGNYAEVEFHSDGRRIDLITLTQNPAEVEAFLLLLQRIGTAEEHLSGVRSLLNFGVGYTIGMKLPIAGDEIGGEIYLRGAIPLNRVQVFLDKHSASADMEKITAIASLFGKGYTHMLAVDAGLDASFTLFFTTYLNPGETESDWLTLEQALGLVSVGKHAVQKLQISHSWLSQNRPETLYFSIPILDGRMKKVVKVDYSSVSLEILNQVMTGNDMEDAGNILLKTWGSLLGVQRANYSGIILSADGIVGIRAYFTVGYGVFS